MGKNIARKMLIFEEGLEIIQNECKRHIEKNIILIQQKEY